MTKNKNRGCEKCDYTGFSYAKIPCECQGLEPEPPKRGVEIPVSGVFSFTNRRPEIKVGDTVAIGDIVIGKALSPVDAGGVVSVAIRRYGEWLDPKTGEKHSIGVTAQVNARDLIVVKSDYE